MQPRLRLGPGTQFGHQTGVPWNRKARVLVEVAEEINLQSGLHLLVAPNGAGKTTFLRTLAGLHPALSGAPDIVGRVNYVSDALQMDGELLSRTLLHSWFCDEALMYAVQLADRLNLDLGCQIGKLSRGNRQKVVLIAAETLAAISAPSLLLLDEPLTGMDAETRAVVADLWASSGSSVLRLVVLHELEAVKQADSLCTVVGGLLRHITSRHGGSWMETCEYLRAQ